MRVLDQRLIKQLYAVRNLLSQKLFAGVDEQRVPRCVQRLRLNDSLLVKLLVMAARTLWRPHWADNG